MNELPPTVRALLKETAAGHDPQPPDVERALQKLHAGLAFSPPALTDVPRPSHVPAEPAIYAGSPLVGAHAVKLYLVVAALVGSLGTFAVFQAKSPEPKRAAVAAAPAPVEAARVEAPAVEAAEPDLIPELSLIERAQRSLQRADTASALRLLEEHAQRFPRSQLRIERQGLRAVALCAAGRREEGVAARAAFLARSPAAPIATRVKSACND